MVAIYLMMRVCSQFFKVEGKAMRIMQQLKTTTMISAAAILLSACSSVSPKQHANNADGTITDTDVTVNTGGTGQVEKFLGDAYSVSAPANQKYYFDLDKSKVYGEYLGSIKAQADYLNHHPDARVRVEGNTDERGSREYNIALGERRADAIAKALEVNGVPAKQVIVVSYGKERLIALAHDAHAHQLNRRVDMIYEAK